MSPGKRDKGLKKGKGREYMSTTFKLLKWNHATPTTLCSKLLQRAEPGWKKQCQETEMD